MAVVGEGEHARPTRSSIVLYVSDFLLTVLPQVVGNRSSRLHDDDIVFPLRRI